ncbi:choice-of-anchor D domain-containing protein [Streptomyces prunicolor]|uniref:choice-of-anchor D domain-containing protein n=1 Tax=Streptomyces prunicolor TaxID=67348 RepID=UPI00344082A1
MNTVLYGAWRVVLTAAHGVRLESVELHLRAQVLAQMRPFRHSALACPPLPGREAPVAAARREILAHRPVEFHAHCGYGKTTLLRYLASGTVWAPAAYVRVGAAPLDDVLQAVVDRLYSCSEPVKVTRAECEQIIRGCHALVVIDDVPPGSRIPNDLAVVLHGRGLVVGSTQPVLAGLGSSMRLPGLPADAAFDLYMRSLGRQLGESELADTQRLLAALDGQPLHIKQAAALVRAGDFTASRLAEEAATDPEALDRLSLSRLSDVKRRALTVLTLFAGALLPAALVSGIGDIAFVLQYLDQLHRDGVVEHPDDRFGIPVCKKESYRSQLLERIDFSAAVRGLADWLANPSGPHAAEALEAALGLLGFASERAEFAVVVRLVRLVEPVLFVMGRWKEWRHVLGQGIEAAQQVGDVSAEALFAHQKGTVAYCENRLQEARDLLERAVELRTRLGDQAGSALSRAHLELMRSGSDGRLPDSDGQSRHRGRSVKARAFLAAVATTAGAVAMVAAVKGMVVGPPPPTTSSVDTVTPGTAHPTDAHPTETESTEKRKTPSADSTPEALGFTDTPTGTRSDPNTLTLTSTGAAPLNVFKATLGGGEPQDFEIATDACSSKELAPGEECRIEVVFRPMTTGRREAVLTIPDNSPGRVRKVQLSGNGTGTTGTLPPDLNPEVTTDGTTLSITIQNLGRGAAGPSTTQVVFKDRITDEDIEPMNKPTVSVRGGGQTNWEVVVPPHCKSLALCTYHVKADVEDTVTEADEANNNVDGPPPESPAPRSSPSDTTGPGIP